jgi:hypothetical protein
MTYSDRHPKDPALDRFGPKPTDRSLPINRRTRPTVYIIALAVVILIGLALVGMGVFQFSESTSDINATGDAAAPTENLLPAAEEDTDVTAPVSDSEVPAGDDPEE